jgi:hypothetical protein
MTQNPSRLNKISQAATEYLSVVRVSLSDWQSDLGLIFNAFALFAFFVAVFRLGFSAVFIKIVTFYRGVTTIIFWPFEKLFIIDIPGYIEDIILIWTVSGAIGARTLIWLFQSCYEGLNKSLKELDNPNTLVDLELKLGKAKLEQEIIWMREKMSFFEITPLRKRVLYMGCFISGPLYFITIWKESPPVPKSISLINGRQMILVQLTTLLMVLGVLFALNWITL